MLINHRMYVPKIGITALVSPELIFACRGEPFDVNNIIPASRIYPANKLCAWTAIWKEMLLKREIAIDSLVVVAGGDCHNALVDGQKAAMSGIPTHFFFYPFDGDPEYLELQLYRLSDFLGGIESFEKFKEIKRLKELGQMIDKRRCQGKISSGEAFRILISFSDLLGDLNRFKRAIESIRESNIEIKNRVALIGVPPIYYDFHETAESLGLQIVFDELPYEFIRHGGTDIREIARDYCDYTFARPLDFRIDFLRKELERRDVDGVIHYTQFACHHMLEDEVLRAELDYPILTIQGDLPGNTPQQIKLRLEAFREMLERLR
ncbi:Benzoyl-CoA reductase/2-hydroxyglutaryl-CoA dehydratase subunit, BcrC/BadD/HgdB [Candidatus Methanoperedens nitroreducens]|uniref:Benzoyl-CoA reductase/2-hydroxyglutaryl-CoA dehydratase subunit, BcrC/BadD/HgdB n=1 Tax=Candidatus Methanoperedens nitratireducens TaxID=1392998 RepID=A0A062VA76_9EURY|nr:2-hydroxyacyl-CoA dehydratase family protein [Candidatus Methanoperedens nitroreducens]KCZ72629.1 Benzoyl-CoA reductase/2-hydroxyglutaryl-CoA dehydratase subunit, BcrC/BadD/HgdB [Candidatus Methanoperedens nitroreducens]MDJ1423439.1 2-hydroxyacyl-CoA dehydratase family protein [Candidatus Methanoperedens sp.]